MNNNAFCKTMFYYVQPPNQMRIERGFQGERMPRKNVFLKTVPSFYIISNANIGTFKIRVFRKSCLVGSSSGPSLRRSCHADGCFYSSFPCHYRVLRH